MAYKPQQRDIIIIDFEPARGSEIKKRGPALVMSRTSYNLATRMVIVCPITSTAKDQPFLTPIISEKLIPAENGLTKVNSLQVFSLDYTPQAGRNITYVDTLEEEVFYEIVQKFQQNFAFQI